MYILTALDLGRLTSFHSGLPRLTDSTSAQSSESVLGYEADQYGPNRPSWSPGFYQGSVSDGVTRYITNGAGVSAPSENLGFYFSGMRSPTLGPIYYDDSSANVTANTLIEVDMSVMRSEKWTNTTLPDAIQPRANAELVWIPVGEKGVLVAIGGVTTPEEIYAMGLNSSQTSESESQSPGFMTTLPVYDVASSEWFMVNTTGQAPPQLTEFCSVVAVSNDSSTFNVYIYGGYDGLNSADEPSDDVWILSLPTFQWVKAYSGTTSHGRSGHRCLAPYPDQMFVVGGVHQNQANCVEGGIVQVFNLNTLEFQDKYNPDKWAQYKVPNIVTQAIGSSTKRATHLDSALAAVFAKPYAKKITHYYPYPDNKSSGNSAARSGSGVSTGAIIGICVAAGVIGLLIIVLLVLLCRRRRIIRSGSSEKSAGSSNSRVSRWLNGAPTVVGSQKRTSPDKWQTAQPEVQQVVAYTSISEDSTPPLQPIRHEMANTTERPKPPFELATDYNDLTHPRHSGVVDYAYNANYGHTHSNTNSSDEPPSAGRPSPLSSGNNSNNPNSASALRNTRLPPRGPVSDVSSPSHDNSSAYETASSSQYSSDTLAWPFPATQNTWRANGTAPRQSRPAPGARNPFEHPRDRSSEGSSVQPIMEEQEPHENPFAGGEEHHSTHLHPTAAHGLPPHNDGDNRFAYQQGGDLSASSGIETLPSPIHMNEGASLPHDENARRSLFETISPVSPTQGRNWYGHGNRR